MLEASTTASASNPTAEDAARTELELLKAQKRRRSPEETLAALASLQRRVRAVSSAPPSRAQMEVLQPDCEDTSTMPSRQGSCSLPEIQPRRRALSVPPLHSRTAHLRLRA